MIIQNEWEDYWEDQFRVIDVVTHGCNNYYAIPCDCDAIIKALYKLDILDLEYLND